MFFYNDKKRYFSGGAQAKQDAYDKDRGQYSPNITKVLFGKVQTIIISFVNF